MCDHLLKTLRRGIHDASDRERLRDNVRDLLSRDHLRPLSRKAAVRRIESLAEAHENIGRLIDAIIKAELGVYPELLKARRKITRDIEAVVATLGGRV